jgi:hypothetical protein
VGLCGQGLGARPLTFPLDQLVDEQVAPGAGGIIHHPQPRASAPQIGGRPEPATHDFAAATRGGIATLTVYEQLHVQLLGGAPAADAQRNRVPFDRKFGRQQGSGRQIGVAFLKGIDEWTAMVCR